MNQPVIRVDDLWFRYRRDDVLRGVGCEVAAAGVCGLVGESGVGKTTLIKHLLGRLQRWQGSVDVFGKNPAVDPAGVLGKIGYLSEDRDLPVWMKVGEFIRHHCVPRASD